MQGELNGCTVTVVTAFMSLIRGMLLFQPFEATQHNSKHKADRAVLITCNYRHTTVQVGDMQLKKTSISILHFLIAHLCAMPLDGKEQSSKLMFVRGWAAKRRKCQVIWAGRGGSQEDFRLTWPCAQRA